MIKKLKQLLWLMMAMAASCQTKPTETTTSADTLKYPYTLPKDKEWQINTDKANTLTALKILKAYETADTTALKPFIADSIRVLVDSADMHTDRAGFLQAVKQYLGPIKNLHFKVEDWETVVSKNKSEEWVSIWYKQYFDSPKGTLDSVAVFNDLQFKNGKMVMFDEYTRHYPKQ